MTKPAPHKRNQRLASIAESYWDFYLYENPSIGAEHGDPRARHILFRESIADYERRVDRLAGFLSELQHIDHTLLAGQDVYTLSLLKRELEESLERYNLQEHLRPTLFPFGPEARISEVANQTVLGTVQDAEDYLVRLSTIPAFLRDVETRLEAGSVLGHRIPDVLLPRVLANVNGFCTGDAESSVWFTPFARSCSALDLSDTRKRALALIEDLLVPSYRHFADALARIFTTASRSTVSCTDTPIGVDYYRFQVKHHTSLSLSPADIHNIGHSEVDSIWLKIEELARKEGAESVEEFKSRLQSDRRFIALSKEDLREKIEVLCKRIDRRIPEYFGLMPRMTYGIESIPVEISAQTPPAYAQPNTADGRSSGIHWITSLPERCPSWMHLPLVLHEAWPGHLMHIALLQEMTDLPSFRRFGISSYNAYIEGWALYCEKLGLDMGFYHDGPEHFGRLELEICRAVRLVVDTGLHANGWTRAMAFTYMKKYTSLPDAVIEAEIDRYIGMPGQALSYKLGELKILELRRRAEKALGTSFRLRDFHDRLMTAGAVTLSVLEQHVDSWIQSEVSQL